MNVRDGCQCKFPGVELEDLLRGAAEWARQAGATVKLAPFPEDCAAVQSTVRTLLLLTDIAPLVGVDLRVVGRISALHAMSDVYASGGVPHWALVLLVSGVDHPTDNAQAVMAGILEQRALERVQLVGGQTIVGAKARAGLTAVGSPRSDQLLRKQGSVVGDQVLLSKPLGVGLILRAYKMGLADEVDLDATIAVMSQSNGPGSASALTVGVQAATDVTGFGLLGHLAEMLAPNQGAGIEFVQVPQLEASSRCSDAGRTFWARNNRGSYFESLRPQT